MGLQANCLVGFIYSPPVFSTILSIPFSGFGFTRYGPWTVAIPLQIKMPNPKKLFRFGIVILKPWDIHSAIDHNDLSR